MEQVPGDVVVHQILKHLNWSEVILLLSTSNKIFSGIRYSITDFRIHIKEFGALYFETVRNKIHSDEQLRFEGELTALLRKKWEQVLRIKGCSLRILPWSGKPDQMDLLSSPLIAKKINLVNISKPLDAKNFSHLQEVGLYQCSTVININYLGNVQKLTIVSCQQMEDISGLGNIPDLYISYCPEIHDISALMNNGKLNIKDYSSSIDMRTANFENIRDLETNLHLTYESTATLKNAQSLNFTWIESSSIYLAKSVTSVEITFGRQEGFSLANFSHLASVWVDELPPNTDLTPLQRVWKVRISGSHHLKTVHGLGMNGIVILENCEALADLSSLKNVARLIVDNCPRFTNCEAINGVRNLTMKWIGKMDFRPFGKNRGGNILRLELVKSWDSITSLEGLGEIPFIKITGCELSSLQGLGEENKTILLDAKHQSLFGNTPSLVEFSVTLLPEKLIMLRRNEVY
jgi:hypothetical protein